MEDLKKWLDKKEEKKEDDSQSIQKSPQIFVKNDLVSLVKEAKREMAEEKESKEEKEEAEEHVHSGYIDKDKKFHCNWCSYVKD